MIFFYLLYFYRIELCNFSGLKIYPGKGKIFVRGDSRSFRFINGKSESYFLQRLKPAKIDWTVTFRRERKKGLTEESTKKKARRTVKAQRAIVGASLQQLKERSQQKPEVRAAERKQAAEAAKAKKRAAAEKKKAEKKSQPKANQAKVSKQQSRGAAAPRSGRY